MTSALNMTAGRLLLAAGLACCCGFDSRIAARGDQPSSTSAATSQGNRALATSSSTRQKTVEPQADQLTVLQFRKEPRCQSAVVRVGDLVELQGPRGADHENLLQLPLAPAPQLGDSQTWTTADIMRHLELRGWQQRVRWSGPDSTQLTRVADAAPLPEGTKLSPAFVQERTIKQATKNIAQATREYLWLKTGERTQWRVTTSLPPEHAAALAQRRNIETLSGGQAPWAGEQLLKIGYRFQGKSYQLDLPVLIDLPTTVVVTVRPMRRDEVIDASALAYGALPERLQDGDAEYFTDFSQVIGKQLRRSMSTGLPIARSAVGEPIVISSGELIEIESVAGMISVKPSARALSGGAVGDLINVELISSKKRMAATVVGPLRVRISGISKVSTASTANTPPRSEPAPLAQVAPSARE